MWLELIHLRAAPARQAALTDALGQLQLEVAREANGVELRFYRNAALPTDYSVHLLHANDHRRGQSDLGLRLAAALKDFGMTESSVWIEEDSP